MRGLTGRDTTPPESLGALHDVVTAEPEEQVEVALPTAGRIVQIRIDVGEDDAPPTLRPALVVERRATPGWLLLHVFLAPEDIPVAPGSRVRFDGTTGFTGAYALCGYGTGSGEWRWPEIAEEPETFLA